MVRLFVGGMHFEVDEARMASWFERQGYVVEGDPQVMRDKVTGRSRCFGFITLDTAEDVDAICAKLHLSDMHGKHVTVRKADPRPPRGTGPTEPRRVAPRQPRGSESDFNY